MGLKKQLNETQIICRRGWALLIGAEWLRAPLRNGDRAGVCARGPLGWRRRGFGVRVWRASFTRERRVELCPAAREVRAPSPSSRSPLGDRSPLSPTSHVPASAQEPVRGFLLTWLLCSFSSPKRPRGGEELEQTHHSPSGPTARVPLELFPLSPFAHRREKLTKTPYPS